MTRLRSAGGRLLAAAVAAALAAAPAAARAAAYSRSVRTVPDCGYSNVLHKEYACRVVTVRGPGYTRVDWFSVGLGEHIYPWERLVWQYRWATRSSRTTACRTAVDGLPAHPTYRDESWVTAERLTIYEAAHTATTAGGGHRRVAARVRRLPWGHKELTIRRVSVRSCQAPNLGLQVGLAGGAGLVPLARLTVVAAGGLSGGVIPLDVVGARAGARGQGAIVVSWPAPETVLATPAAGVVGARATDLAQGLPAAPAARVGQGATVSLPLRPGTWTLGLKGSAQSAPHATVSVVATNGGAVPVAAGEGVLVVVPGGTTESFGLTLKAPSGLGPVAAATVSQRTVAARGGGSIAVAPLAVAPGAAAATLSVNAAASPGAYRLSRLVITWTGANGQSVDQSLDLAVEGMTPRA